MPMNERQTSALRMLRAGKAGGQIARELKVRPETVSRWQQLPAFQDALAASKDGDLDDQDTNLVYLKWRAFDTLSSLLESNDESVRLRAAAEIYRTWGTSLPRYTGPDQEPVEDLANDD